MNNNPRVITPRVSYNESLARFSARLISFDTILFLRLLRYFFEISEPLDPKTVVLQKDAELYYKLREVDFRTEERDRKWQWPEVMDDLEDLIALLKRCSDGANYKEAWKQIREPT